MKTKEILKQALDYTKPVMWRIIGFDILQYLSIMILFAIMGLIFTFLMHTDKTVPMVIGLITYFILFITFIISIFVWPLNAYAAKIKFITNQQNNKNPKFKELWKDSFKLNFKIIKVYFLLLSITIVTIAVVGYGSYTVAAHLLHSDDTNFILQAILPIIGIAFIELCPVAIFSIITATVMDHGSIHSVWYSVKYIFCKHFLRLIIIPTLLIGIPCWLMSSITDLLNNSLVNATATWQITGSVIFFISVIFYILLSLVLSVYIVSYYLINLYDGQTKIEENTTISAN